jgi:hypothetical protein
MSDVATSWVPDEIDPAETVESIGTTAYGLLCDHFSSYVHELYSSQLLVRAACTMHALRTTTNMTECTEATDRCLGTLPGPVENELESILSQASCDTSGVLPSGCDAPVAELLACLGELRDEVEQIQMAATCAAFGPDVPDGWWRIAQPNSCIDLATQCGRND